MIYWRPQLPSPLVRKKRKNERTREGEGKKRKTYCAWLAGWMFGNKYEDVIRFKSVVGLFSCVFMKNIKLEQGVFFRLLRTFMTTPQFEKPWPFAFFRFYYHSRLVAWDWSRDNFAFFFSHPLLPFYSVPQQYFVRTYVQSTVFSIHLFFSSFSSFPSFPSSSATLSSFSFVPSSSSSSPLSVLRARRSLISRPPAKWRRWKGQGERRKRKRT